MNPISKQDYLKLLEAISEQQYSEPEEPAIEVPESSWIWGESPVKDRLRTASLQQTIDVTLLHKDQIKKAIKSARNIKVGNFSIKIKGYYQSEKLNNDFMHLDIYERRTKTPTGQPCNMDYKAELTTDKRFAGRGWLSYFTKDSPGLARNVPIDTVVDIIKWMKALKNLTIFL
jgi:hypothetical protein